MYYKVLKDNKVIDVLDNLVYVKWQEKNKIMVLCDENTAQGIISSDGKHIWHEPSLYRFPNNVDGYDNIELVEIDVYEYEQLKALNLKSAEDIFDQAVFLTMQKFLGI